MEFVWIFLLSFNVVYLLLSLVCTFCRFEISTRCVNIRRVLYICYRENRYNFPFSFRRVGKILFFNLKVFLSGSV